MHRSLFTENLTVWEIHACECQACFLFLQFWLSTGCENLWTLSRFEPRNLDQNTSWTPWCYTPRRHGNLMSSRDAIGRWELICLDAEETSCRQETLWRMLCNDWLKHEKLKRQKVFEFQAPKWQACWMWKLNLIKISIFLTLQLPLVRT